jgi:molybdopterin-guanine dinucleotide biosynthesis protein A
MIHQKHTKLTKPIGGKWGRTEVAILGAPCDEIKKLVGEITEMLSQDWQVAYVDAEHNAPETTAWSALKFGARAQITDKISHYAMEQTKAEVHFFNDADLVIVNGNHFLAQNQIAWVHPKKSLEKKLAKLNNVGLIILEDDESVPTYLVNHLSGKEYQVIHRSELSTIKKHFLELIDENTPQLNGLVLLGGKSTRMNTDKSQLVYQSGLPHHAYMSNLLAGFCKNVYLSVRDEKQGNEYEQNTITDKFVGLGPYGGILSAFQHDPNAAWLVVAVDLPYLDESAIKQLTAKRNIHKAATCFIDRHNEFPEPLITIWEPRAYPILLNFLARGYSCPRKALINSDVEIITERSLESLTNVNTPEDLASAREILNRKA